MKKNLSVSDKALMNEAMNPPVDHSPLPWIQVLLHPQCLLSKPGIQQEVVDFPNTPRGRADATLVHRAVNHHRDLVEALKLLMYGAQQAVDKGLVQPQVNGGLVLAKVVLESIKAAEEKFASNQQVRDTWIKKAEVK